MRSCLSRYHFGLIGAEVGYGCSYGMGWALFCLLNQRENGQVCPNLRPSTPMENGTGRTHESILLWLPARLNVCSYVYRIWKQWLWLCISLTSVTIVTKAVSYKGSAWMHEPGSQLAGWESQRGRAARGCMIRGLDASGDLFSCGFSIRSSCEWGSRSHPHEMRHMMTVGRGRVNITKDEWIW